MEDHKVFEEDFLRQEGTLRETLNIGQDIMKRCHPDAVSTMKHWLSVLKSRWEEVGIPHPFHIAIVMVKVSSCVSLPNHVTCTEITVKPVLSDYPFIAIDRWLLIAE